MKRLSCYGSHREKQLTGREGRGRGSEASHSVTGTELRIFSANPLNPAITGGKGGRLIITAAPVNMLLRPD